MRESSRILRSGLLAGFLVLVFAANSVAYIGQTHWTVTVTAGSAVIFCDRDMPLTATVVETSTNHRVYNAKVTWSIYRSKSRFDRLTWATTHTNIRGKTYNTLSFGNRAGIRVVKARAGGVNGTTSVMCKLRPHHLSSTGARNEFRPLGSTFFSRAFGQY